jgi:hypothetical protein
MFNCPFVDVFARDFASPRWRVERPFQFCDAEEDFAQNACSGTACQVLTRSDVDRLPLFVVWFRES